MPNSHSQGSKGAFLPAFEKLYQPLAKSMGKNQQAMAALLGKSSQELEEALRNQFETLATGIEAESHPLKLNKYYQDLEKLLDLIVSNSNNDDAENKNLKQKFDQVKNLQDENLKREALLQFLRSQEIQKIVARNIAILAQNPDFGRIFQDAFHKRFKNTTNAFARASDQLAYDPITQIMSIWYDMIMIMFETLAKIILGDGFVGMGAEPEQNDPSRDRIVPMPMPAKA